MFLEFALIMGTALVACIPISIIATIICFLSIHGAMLKKEKENQNFLNNLKQYLNFYE